VNGILAYLGSKVFWGSTESVGFILGSHVNLAEAKVAEGEVACHVQPMERRSMGQERPTPYIGRYSQNILRLEVAIYNVQRMKML
jgi:hypothetical protein